MGKPIRIGIDFDGVVAYSPTRLLRAPISIFKRLVLKKKKLSFFVPQKPWQMWIWAVVFGPSVLPAPKIDKLRELAKDPNYELHLVTGRFDFLEDNMRSWLQKKQLLTVFKTVNVNTERLQPHLYKQKMIKKLKLIYFVDDNWDVVNYLKENTNISVLWMFNIVDIGISYDKKFPDLGAMTAYVRKESSV